MNEKPVISLEVPDIINATRIIGAAMERGNTFKASEMSSVAALYDKLAAFVQQEQERAQQEHSQQNNEGAE